MSNIEDILQFIKAGDFEKLIGQVEDEYLEFKSEAYHLNDDKNKFEFAKDVSSFANSKGGIILLGIETEKSVDHPTEKATKVNLIKKNSFNKEQYLQIISSWIYPDLNVEIDFVPSPSDADKGLICIHIKENATSLKPYLVKKAFFEDSAKSTGNVYAFFQRKASMNQPYSVEEMQRFFKDGMRYDEHLSDMHFLLSQNLAGPSNKKTAYNNPEDAKLVTRPASLSSKKVAYRELMMADFLDSIVSCKLDKETTYSLGFLPEPLSDLTSMFEGKNSKIYRLIQSPPEIRDHGFDLDTGDNYSPKIIDGTLLRACASQFKLLDIRRDGGVFFTSSADDYLCWASQTEGYLRINPLAPVESIYLFVNFVSEIYKGIKPKPENYIFTVLFRNPKGVKYGLYKGPLKRCEPPSWDIKFLSEKEILIEKQFDALDLHKIAYALLFEFYLKFGHLSDAIPYVKKENDKYIIDVEKIQSPK